MNVSITQYLADANDLGSLVTETTKRLIEQNAVAVETALEDELRELLYRHIAQYRNGDYDDAGECVDAIVSSFKALIRRRLIVS